MTTTTETAVSLREALYQLSLAKRIPDAELLDDFIRRYPEHASELTEFAIELALDAGRADDDEFVDEEEVAVTPAVSRVISKFQNRLFEKRNSEGSAAARFSASSATPENPFSTLDHTALRSFARSLNANTVFVHKLRDRQIEPGSMTDGFRQRVADELRVSIEIVAAHFAGPAELGARSQFYKADEKPRVSSRQSFEDAVKSSGLTEEQQKYLMTL